MAQFKAFLMVSIKTEGPYSQHFILFVALGQISYIFSLLKANWLVRDKHSSLLGPFLS
jgi:hypothetical protein